MFYLQMIVRKEMKLGAVEGVDIVQFAVQTSASEDESWFVLQHKITRQIWTSEISFFLSFLRDR